MANRNISGCSLCSESMKDLAVSNCRQEPESVLSFPCPPWYVEWLTGVQPNKKTGWAGLGRSQQRARQFYQAPGLRPGTRWSELPLVMSAAPGKGSEGALGQGLQHLPVGLHKFLGVIWIKLILLLSPYSCLLSNLGFPLSGQLVPIDSAQRALFLLLASHSCIRFCACVYLNWFIWIMWMYYLIPISDFLLEWSQLGPFCLLVFCSWDVS